VTLHQWLHLHGPLCEAAEVCWRHLCHGFYPWRRWVSISTASGSAGALVQSEQAEHAQDGGDVDFRRHPPTLCPLTVLSSPVATVESFRFLGTIISQDLKWEQNICSILKKAQQRMYFLRLLRKHGLPQELLLQLYAAVIEFVLCPSITVWFGAATKKDRTRLQRTVRTAEHIIVAPLPSIQDLYRSRTRKRAGNIMEESSHPAHSLFELPQSPPDQD